MTPAEQDAVRILLRALSEGEWVKDACLRCRFSRARGHKCSCPVKRAQKVLRRAVERDPRGGYGLEDDDLIVAGLVRDLARTPAEGWGRLVRDAVDAAVAYGAKA